MAGERTEKATPKRKQDERKKGNIFLSQEVVTVLTLLAVFYVIKAMMPFVLTTLEESIGHYTYMGAEVAEISYDNLRDYFFDLGIVFVKAAVIPLYGVLSGCGNNNHGTNKNACFHEGRKL